MPRLHVVTDDAVLDRNDVPAVGRELLNAFGPDVALHIRGPRTSARRVFEVGATIADGAGVRNAGGEQHLYVNDRVDLAMMLGAGVHLGARSLPVAAVRTLMDDGTSLGRSIHEHPEEGTGADYVFAGPVYATASHPDAAGRGADWLEEIVSVASTPVLGIGGISAERIGVLLSAGAHGVALIRGVWDAPDPLGAIAELIAQIKDAE